jgi:hypothetical protein
MALPCLIKYLVENHLFNEENYFKEGKQTWSQSYKDSKAALSGLDIENIHDNALVIATLHLP